MLRKITSVMLSAVFIISAAITTSAAEGDALRDKMLVSFSAEESESYEAYSKELKSELYAKEEINLVPAGGSVLLVEGESITFDVSVPTDAIYQIKLTYKTADESTQNPSCALRVDGALPFDGASNMWLSRLWKNETEILQDATGNDLYQSQIQLHDEYTEYLRDPNGYFDEPYLFLLTAGAHTIELRSVQCEYEITSLTLCTPRELQSYEKKLSEYKAAGLKEAQGIENIKIQAENVTVKSSAMLAAVADRSSPAIEPAVEMTTRLNILGGGRFDDFGQWIEYKIENIPADGLYQLTFKVKQNECKGINVARNIYVNGEIPFAEAKNFTFSYSNEYENVVFGGEEGAYLIPLKKGTNTIRFEASLGEVADICRRVESSLEKLNGAYREIITVTGTTPDVYRDYDIQSKMPHVVELFKTESEALSAIVQEMQGYFGKSSSFTAILNSAVLVLDEMYDDPYTIPENVSAFNSNLSSMGSMVGDIKRTDISLDYFMITESGAEMPRATGTFFEDITFGFRQFMYSFVLDYSALGEIDGVEETISSWIISGRDQTQILKQLIESDFTPESKIAVETKLVSDTTTLLQATLAGVGPDVALNIPKATIMNFAFRGAVEDLSKYTQTADMVSRFTESSMISVRYGDAIYGIPQTASYSVMFYRADILDELNIAVPKTWDDVYRILPTLTQNNMIFGLPTLETGESYIMLLYQNGGKYYSDDLQTSLFDSEVAIRTMDSWAEFYSGYGMPVSYDFANRFASGEMPLAVADYSTAFNTLVAFAPQIEGLWGITLVPGTPDENGNVDHSSPVNVTASIVLSDSKHKEAAVEFIDWWSSDEAQINFGSFLESLLGAAGRYAIANVAGLEKLSWTKLQARNLKLQLENTVGVPEVPGGYYTGRNLNNAFRAIIDDGIDVREAMYDCNKLLSEEMQYQRDALGIK